MTTGNGWAQNGPTRRPALPEQDGDPDAAERAHIRSLRAKGYSVSDLADAYQLSTEAILAILRDHE